MKILKIYFIFSFLYIFIKLYINQEFKWKDGQYMYDKMKYSYNQSLTFINFFVFISRAFFAFLVVFQNFFYKSDFSLNIFYRSSNTHLLSWIQFKILLNLIFKVSFTINWHWTNTAFWNVIASITNNSHWSHCILVSSLIPVF